MARSVHPVNPAVAPPTFVKCECGRDIRVERGRIVQHDRHPLLRAICPGSGQEPERP